jgi:Na+/melibiose symporter-like transporter
MKRWTKKSSRVRARAEEALLDTPLPHSGAPPAPPRPEGASRPAPARLLANRPLTWLVIAHGVLQLGFWAFLVVVLGQASYRFHAGPLQLGLLFSSFSVSFLLLTAPFGMIVDRWSPKWSLIVGEVIALAAVVIVLFGHSLWWLYVSSVVDGVGAAAAIPARGSLSALLVDEESLVRANGLLNTAAMMAVIFGPGVAGALVGSGSAQAGYTAAYAFILAVVAVGTSFLLFVPDRRPRDGEEDGPEGGFVADLVEGFRVSIREPELRSLLILAAMAWFLLTVLVTLEPLFVKDVLHRGVDSMGFLWSAHGVGALLGALAVTRLKRAGGREVGLIGGSMIVSAVGYLLYVGSSLWALAVAGNFLFGVAFAWYLSLSQALIQRVAAENMRGRVTGVVGMLQETSALACSLTIAVLGGLVVVQPYLVVSGAALLVGGGYGLRAGRRIRRMVLLDRQAETIGGNPVARSPIRSDG